MKKLHTTKLQQFCMELKYMNTYINRKYSQKYNNLHRPGNADADADEESELSLIPMVEVLLVDVVGVVGDDAVVTGLLEYS